jgi:hypothetical protein
MELLGLVHSEFTVWSLNLLSPDQPCAIGSVIDRWPVTVHMMYVASVYTLKRPRVKERVELSHNDRRASVTS